MLLIIPAIDENRKLWYDTLVWNTKRGRKEPLLMHWDIRYTEETDKYYPALLEVVKKTHGWNDAWWLLRYQMMTMVETFKRLL